MKISIIAGNLSNNSFGRAYLLAKVLQRRHEVEIVGVRFNGGIWAPCDTSEFIIKSVLRRAYPRFFFSIPKMLSYISGHVIYAVKLQPTSFGFALLKKLQSKKPIVLDVDDWELGFYKGLGKKGKLVQYARFWSPDALPYIALMEKLSGYADEITVASSFLQKKFGGTLVPHGRDTNAFDPAKFNGEKIRKQWGLAGFKVIMFMGTPRPYKGLEQLIAAVNRLSRDDIRLMIIGMGSRDWRYEESLKDKANEKLVFVGMQPFDQVPEFLSMADLVVLPQSESKETIGQVPAKIFDAMAMAKPIISTRVSDIPQILEGCGIIVEPGNIDQLVEKVSYVLENSQQAQEMGRRAREKCIKEYSWDAMEKVLARVFNQFAG